MSIKSRWQRMLDGKSRGMFEDIPRRHTAKPVRVSASAVGRPDPYGQLRTLGGDAIPNPSRVRVYELPDPHHADEAPSLATPAQRAYEVGLPHWAREALAEMDAVVYAVIYDELSELRTPQFIRRNRRSMAETMGELPTLQAVEDVPAFVERITARARRASAPDVTGMIPVVVPDAVVEEAWA